MKDKGAGNRCQRPPHPPELPRGPEQTALRQGSDSRRTQVLDPVPDRRDENLSGAPTPGPDHGHRAPNRLPAPRPRAPRQWSRARRSGRRRASSTARCERRNPRARRRSDGRRTRRRWRPCRSGTPADGTGKDHRPCASSPGSRNAASTPPCHPANPVPAATAPTSPALCSLLNSSTCAPSDQHWTTGRSPASRSASQYTSRLSATSTANPAPRKAGMNNSVVSTGEWPSHPPRTTSARRGRRADRESGNGAAELTGMRPPGHVEGAPEAAPASLCLQRKGSDRRLTMAMTMPNAAKWIRGWGRSEETRVNQAGDRCAPRAPGVDASCSPC